ncbi:MAG: MFS transporter [Elusimicrobia bacterium]|nr:MFS transporter [Elusimicrobiota bacterium]
MRRTPSHGPCPPPYGQGLRRTVAASLAALLALLAPGPQAWAAAVKTGVAASGQSLPAGRIVALPDAVSGGISALSSGISLDLGGRAPAAVPQIKDSGIGAALPSAPALTLPAFQVVPAAQVQTQAKIGGLAEQSAPVLDAVAAPKASSADLHRGGAELQRILGSSLRRHAAPADVELGPAEEGPIQTPASKLSAARDGAQESPASEPVPELTPEQKGKFRFYSGAVAAVKVGIEGLNLAVPLLLLNTLHAAMAVSTLYLAAEVASIFAGLVGGALVDRIGARRALVLNGFVQAAAIIGVPIAIASGGALALPIVYALFMLNGIASELFDVARRAALPQIVGQNEGLLRKYNGSLYVWREIAATAGVLGAGWLVHHIGAMATIWMHPAFCVAAARAALRLLKQGKSPAAAAAAAAARPQRPSDGLKAWWDDIKRGTKYVASEKKLRTIVLVNIPLNALHKIFHTLVAVIFASQVLHNPAMAAVMLGAWNIGELAGAFYLERRGPQSRLSNWLRLAAAASLAVWGWWLFPSALVGVAVSVFLAAAMIGNELGTSSYMQASVPEKELGAVTGFVYAFARAVGILALMLSGFAWDTLGAMGGFLALAVFFTVAAPIYWLASRRFAGDKIDHPAPPPQD